MGSRPAVPSARRGLTLVELLFVLAIISLLIALCMPATRSARGPARLSQCRNNLKQIGLALHNYHDAYGSFPPAYTVDAKGRPLHSWRTLILPYLDAGPLYQQIDLSKPWDDPANLKAGQERFYSLDCPAANVPPGRTVYLAMVTSSSLLRTGQSCRMRDVSSDVAKTLMVVEVDADHAVPWMSPQDADEALLLSLGPQSKLSHPGRILLLNVDGSIESLDVDAPAEDRRSRISVARKE